MSTATANHWPDAKCARAFWGQHELPPYQQLLADTAAWFNPRPAQRWLDLGCGCGKLSEALWNKSEGKLAEIVGVDCAAINAMAYEHLASSLSPSPREEQLRFVHCDFSAGLKDFASNRYDGVVSGLAIQYAEHFDTEKQAWTRTAYEGLLREIQRVLVPGGSLVFSVNVPEPSWGRVAWAGLSGTIRSAAPQKFIKRAWRMWRYGTWLSREARRGRFHYLPLEEIVDRLKETGFVEVESRLSYVDQAYILRCKKPSSACGVAK